ncbi:MAG TPA: 4-carboxymuconolactone decarboxylase, partial [Dietzia sp.]|nr:4-carboxymuconolactone decarboxylase [Dietzia sp.]
LTNGLTREETTEAVIHASEYCGARAALAATRTVQTVFDDLDG